MLVPDTEHNRILSSVAFLKKNKMTDNLTLFILKFCSFTIWIFLTATWRIILLQKLPNSTFSIASKLSAQGYKMKSMKSNIFISKAVLAVYSDR